MSDNFLSRTAPTGGVFPTTRWSLVLSAGRAGTRSEGALESLCQIYWPAVYVYARRRGYSDDQAEDLTQGFFLKLLEKDYVGQADRERGKFRTFLLSSFKNYLANEWDRARAQKRGGKHYIISLDCDDVERRLKIEPAETTTPETLFTRQWASTLLNRVLDRLQGEMAAAGNAERFDRMKNFMTGLDAEETYRHLAATLGMTESAVKVAIHRMRRRFAHLLREEVEHTVESSDSVSDEIRFLIGVLAS